VKRILPHNTHPENSISRDTLIKYGLDITKDKLFIDYRIIKDFNHVNPDSIFFTTKIRKKQELTETDFCEDFLFSFSFDPGRIMINFTDTGCSTGCFVNILDKKIGGNKHDLSKMSMNLKKIHQIDIEFIYSKIRVLVDENVVFESEIKEQLIMLKGINIITSGIGEFFQMEINGEPIH
jgi:hypothetical protein